MVNCFTAGTVGRKHLVVAVCCILGKLPPALADFIEAELFSVALVSLARGGRASPAVGLHLLGYAVSGTCICNGLNWQLTSLNLLCCQVMGVLRNRLLTGSFHFECAS